MITEPDTIAALAVMVVFAATGPLIVTVPVTLFPPTTGLGVSVKDA